MNVADARYGPGLWVCLRLPDGRRAVVGEKPEDAPAAAAIRHIHAGSGKPQDWALVTVWMDEREPLPDGQLFTWRAA